MKLSRRTSFNRAFASSMGLLLALPALAQPGSGPAPMIKRDSTMEVSEHVFVIPDDNVGFVPNVGIVFGLGYSGGAIPLAATWNATMLASLAYLVLYWALNYGMIVASPDDQGFLD